MDSLANSDICSNESHQIEEAKSTLKTEHESPHQTQEEAKFIYKTEYETAQSTEPHRMKKRHFEYTSFFQGLFDDSDVSPRKVSRKDIKGYGLLSLKDTEIIQKGRERLREYRHYLSKKLEAPKYDLHMAASLRKKEELITCLTLRVAELENTSKSNDDTSISGSDSDVKATSTQKLLSIISRLQEENETLKEQVSDMKLERAADKENFKRDSERWSGGLFKFNGKEYNFPSREDQELSDLKHRVVELEKQLEISKEEKDSLSCRLSENKANQLHEERRFRQKINDLEMKLTDLELECMRKDIQFIDHLANHPSMIIVESKSPRHYNLESLQVLEDKLKSIVASHSMLKKQLLQFPMLIRIDTEDAITKIQEAIRTTDEKNKELVSKYTREIQLRKLYHNQLVELKGNIRVYCRVRPSLPADGLSDPVASFDPFDDGVIFINSKGKSQKFNLDKVFSMTASQSQVFEEVSALVRSAIDGFNVCIFAYGQTGSGKTHTMEGVPHDPGVNQRALQLLYEETKTSGWQYSLETSMMEIYNESLRDLLNPDPNTNKLEVKMKQEGGFYIPGLVTVPVKSLSEVNKVIEAGCQNRAMASTGMNERSSRSHSLLCVQVTGVNVLTGNKTFGRLNLVDLAGSERVSKSQADGARLKEAQYINKSLSALGDVINALKNKHAHVPYRNSRLTYLLQESLGGDSKTLMILQISPGEENVSESICTLTFGQRVRSAELGPAKKKTEGTPTTSRSAESSGSPMSGTPSVRVPSSTKASPMITKLGQRLKP
ncbi:hypothetical protein BsWGS_27019 [Bradybaena similaris]